jgi:hypothetical protein
MSPRIAQSNPWRGPSPGGTDPLTLEALFTSLQDLTTDDELIVSVVRNLCDSGVLRRAVDRRGPIH